MGELKAQIREEMVEEVEDLINGNTYRLIDGILLAMNSTLGVGAVRAERVMTKANEYINSLTAEELHQLVRKKIYRDKEVNK